MILREQYIKKIQPFMDKPELNIITKIRSSGMSEFV